MRSIKLEGIKSDINFPKAREIAGLKAKSELGDCMSIAYYDGDQKLVSPTLTVCSKDEADTCGAGSYAKSFDADLEIVVNDRHKFFYRHIENYETSSPSPWEGDPEGKLSFGC